MNYFFVVATEYQLLQAQCLMMHLQKINEFNYLGIIGTRNIDFRLIYGTNFTSIIKFPSLYSEGSINKLSKKYISNLENLYFEILRRYNLINKFPITLIGANDETTEFAILKKIISPSFYFSIEDGLANYYCRKPIDKLKIIFKNILFNYFYKKNIKLYLNYGESENNVSYRLFPELSTNKGYHFDLKPILKNYINQYFEQIKSNFSVTDYRILSKSNELHVVPIFYEISDYLKLLKRKLNAIILPHPSRREFIKTKILDERIYTGPLPIELLLIINNDTKIIHFYSPSTSIITLLALFEDKKIYYHGKVSRKHRNLFHKLKTVYPNNFFIERII